MTKSRREKTTYNLHQLVESAKEHIKNSPSLRSEMKSTRKFLKQFSTFFNKMDNNPCPTCTSVCCGPGNGFFRPTDVHEDLLSGKANLMDYYVGSTKINENRGNTEVCVFLDVEKGCNIPGKYRSSTCLSHFCPKISKVLNNTGQMGTLIELRGKLYNKI